MKPIYIVRWFTSPGNLQSFLDELNFFTIEAFAAEAGDGGTPGGVWIIIKYCENE